MVDAGTQAGTMTPTLTFGEAPEPQAAPAMQEEKKEPELNENVLTDEERKMAEDFSKQIDLTNSTAILQYGVGTQKKMSDFSENALKNVRTKDLGEVGKLLSDVVVELKSFDEDEDSKGFRGLFKKSSNKMVAMRAKYDKAEVNVDKIVKVLDGHQVQLMKDTATLDQMYQMNMAYYKELTMYILAGKLKLKEVNENELPALKAKAQASGLPEDAQAARDMEEMIGRFEKKLHDLELTRMIAIQTAPQIRLIQSSNIQMVEKIQSTVVNTIPLWKNQMVLAIGMEHSTQAAKAQREVADVTNEMLKKNAEALHSAAVETAKESERGVVEVETLKQTNEKLIATLNEVLQIQQEGKEKRRIAEEEMGRMETELKDTLLHLASAK